MTVKEIIKGLDSLNSEELAQVVTAARQQKRKELDADTMKIVEQLKSGCYIKWTRAKKEYVGQVVRVNAMYCSVLEDNGNKNWAAFKAITDVSEKPFGTKKTTKKEPVKKVAEKSTAKKVETKAPAKKSVATKAKKAEVETSPFDII